MRVAPTVVLSPEELERLRRWRDAAASDPARAQRAQVVLLAATGASDLEVAARMSVHRRTVARWRRRFLTARLDGLAPASRVLERGGVPDEQVAAILQASRRPLAPGERLPSTRSLARGHGVGHSTVHRLWATHGVRPARLRERFPRVDPGRPLAPWDVVGLYLDGRSAAMAVSLRPIAPEDPAARAIDARSGGSGMSGPPEPGGVPPPPRDPVGTGGVLPFLTGLLPRVPPSLSLHVLVWTEDPRWARWVARTRLRTPALQLERASDRSTWGFRAAALVQACGRRERRDDRGRGPAELGGALRRWLSDYRPGAGAYAWRASPRDIARGEAAYRLRSELAGTGHAGFLPPGAGPGSAQGVSSDRPPADDDERLGAMARSIVRRSLRVARGEWVLIDTWSSTVREANAIALEALRAGGRPSVVYRDEATFWAATTEVSADQLTYFGAHRKTALERTDVFVSFFGPSDRERLHALPRRVVARFRDAQDLLLASTARTGARAVQLALGRVSPASARMYGVDATAWRSELIDATLVEPRVLARRARWLVERLSRPGLVRVRHPNGTDLTLRLLGRRPEVSDGRVPGARPGGAWNSVTLPAGVVVAPLAESIAEGVFVSNQASSVGLSTTVGAMAGGRWAFSAGRLVRATYDVGDELFAQSFARAPEGRERPGALSFGLNERVHVAPLLEDQALGTVTLQIGRNDHLGGRNRVSWWAWLYLRGADVTVDGERVVRGGRIVP